MEEELGEQILHVKGSGLATPGHAQDFRIFPVPALAPEAKQYQISLTERQVDGASVAISKDVLVEQTM